jgi:DNA-binding CsgD family transcriptional regulator
MRNSHDELSGLIGQLYDCAVQPELWPQTLNSIKKSLDLAVLQVVSVDANHLRQGQAVQTLAFKTLFEHNWVNDFARHFNKIPGGSDWFETDIDVPVSQMQLVSEADFRESEFYRDWIAPRGLRDTCTMHLVKRDHLICALTASGSEKRELFSDHDRDMMRQLAPHIRRSLMIGDMLDEGNYKLSLYRDILDRISTGVMIVSHGAKLVYANGAAEDLLRSGQNLKVRNGQVESAYSAFAGGFRAALDRACSDNDSEIGNFGNGIPLPSREGETAVCYVLPLGKSDHRRSLGPGHAAVFISAAGSNMPPSQEILSALSGLTSRESRIALMIADGSTPADAAGKLGVTMNTMRTHLSRIFDKTGANSQPALVRFVANLSMPVRLGAAH